MPRLNVGCGGDILQGWVNVDLAATTEVDVVCDACHLPFRDGAFDSSFAKDLLHHLDTPRRAIEEITRVTKGCVEIWESNRYNPYMLSLMIQSGFRHSHYSMRRFKRLFKGHSVGLKRGNNWDHFGSRFASLLKLYEVLSLLVPSYNVADLQGLGGK